MTECDARESMGNYRLSSTTICVCLILFLLSQQDQIKLLVKSINGELAKVCLNRSLRLVMRIVASRRISLSSMTMIMPQISMD
ncbi:hypothetical protein BT63DRAFT_75684 [Microthyrium microscopicum]|uniref:Uncharacterized protein n=1 Tax=Microthyrium microscopicum TaxID=703497 RepID=A0A6A6U0H0_9PEZI|nr:hypothetical protein BT63DRAFT_75684 [Microthyrium microscopicum]